MILFAKPTKYSGESLVGRIIKGPGKSFVRLFLIQLGLTVSVIVIALTAWPEALLEVIFCLDLCACSFVFGIALPMAFSNLFNLGCGQEIVLSVDNI